MTGRPDPPVADRARWTHRWRAWLGRSLLPRLLIAFALALIVALAVMFLVDTRLTRQALRTQATRMLQSDVATIEASIAESQSDLATAIRNAGETLSLEAATRPGNRDRLIQRLSDVQRNLSLTAIATIDSAGRIRAALGEPLQPPPAGLMPDLTRGPPNRLVPLAGGEFGQAAITTIGTGANELLLVGVLAFDDAAAYNMRALTGNDVLLTAGGSVVGHTLARGADIPAVPAAPPDDAAVVQTGERMSFVHFTPIASGDGTWSVDGMAGALVPEPVGRLDAALTQSRIIGVTILFLIAAALGGVLFARVTRPMMDLAATAREFADGNLDARFSARTRDEVGFLAAALEDMRRAARERLDVIREQAARLRGSSRRIVQAQDEERRRLARDLHDGVQQQLVMLKLKVGMAASTLPDDPVAAGGLLEELGADIDATIESLRETGQTIYPSILRDRGLRGAVNSLAGRSPVPIDVDVEPDPPPRLEELLEASAYHVVAEAVGNALKHSGCDRITVRVRVDPDQLEVTVRDDGIGFEPAEVATSGLRHMEDRCTALGGHLEITSGPGRGTTLRGVMPRSG